MQIAQRVIYFGTCLSDPLSIEYMFVASAMLEEVCISIFVIYLHFGVVQRNTLVMFILFPSRLTRYTHLSDFTD